MARMRRAILQLIVVAVYVIAGPAPVAFAATPLSELRFSPDISAGIGTPGAIVIGGTVAAESPSGAVAPVDIVFPLPAGTHVAAYHVAHNGDLFLAFDTAVSLPAGCSRSRVTWSRSTTASIRWFSRAPRTAFRRVQRSMQWAR